MRLARILGCLAILIGFSFSGAVRGAELTTESLAQIKENLEGEKAVLVDVREKREWDAGHIEGAIFLPLSRLQNGLTAAELKSLPKDKPLYIHCVVGKRAVTAGNLLERRGFEVRPIKPGYREMISAGFAKAKE